MTKVFTGKNVKFTVNGMTVQSFAPSGVPDRMVPLFRLLAKLGIRSASTIVDRRPLIFMHATMVGGGGGGGGIDLRKSVVIKNVT